MTRTLEAIVKGESLQPVQKLGLPENERVLITVTTLSPKSDKTAESCYDAALRLGAIGVAKDTTPDLSSNPDHLNGFGS